MKIRIMEFTLTSNIQIHQMSLNHWNANQHQSIVQWETHLLDNGMLEILDRTSGEIEYIGAGVVRGARTTKNFIDAEIVSDVVGMAPMVIQNPGVAQVEERTQPGEIDEHGNKNLFRGRKPKKAQ